jgi:amino acid transporter
VSLINLGAVISPFGGGLVATGSMARLALALARNRFFPAIFARVSRFGVPGHALVLNLAASALLFLLLPFQELLTLNGAAIILSFAAGPISLASLRRLDPHRPRAFRLPAAGLLAPLAFTVATLIIYWSGWDNFWRLAVCLGIGLVLLAIRVKRISSEAMDTRQALWLLPYLLGLGIVSYLGDFGHGLALLPFGWDLVVIALFSVAIFYHGVACRLPAERYSENLRE